MTHLTGRHDNDVHMMPLLAAMLILILGGCTREPSIATLDTVPDIEPDQQYRTARIVITEGGVTGAIVSADSINVFMDRNYTEIAGGMTIDFFDRDGEQTSTLTSDTGEVWGLYEEVDSLTARGDVVVVSADGLKRMETASAFTWVSATRTISADSLVTLITEDAVERGYNFVAADDLSEYRMDNVTGRYEGQGLPLTED